jgi:predicted NBD/HSP70 family sugar kinase
MPMGMRKIDLTNFRLATSETARQINRRIALNFLRRHQPMSRADLARHSGLQRSTVSAIVDQLIKEKWVTEGPGRGSLRGRRPRDLHLNVERAGILGVELRPELTTVGLAGLDARFVDRRVFPTSRDPEQFLSDLADATGELRRAHPRIVCEGMGVSLPGRVDRSGRLVFAPNLRWPLPVPIEPMIAKAVGLPVNVENAANACALAELWFGQHPDHVRHMVAVTVSEGIGVGLLLSGQLVHGAHSMAGEFGHRVIDPSGPLCRCGRRGCWERYASNSAAVARYLEARARGGEGGTPTLYRFDDLPRLADEGDPHAIDALEKMARSLGEGLADVMTVLAPEVIVVVGEVTAAWDRVGPLVAEAIADRALPGTVARVVPTDPATQPRLRGAIALVVQQHFGAPVVA